MLPGVTQPWVEHQEMGTALMQCDVSPSTQFNVTEGHGCFLLEHHPSPVPLSCDGRFISGYAPL